MTAAHPQTSFELLHKTYRDYQERLHTEPRFPAPNSAEEARAQQAEVDAWRQQERYGKPIPAFFHQILGGLGILLLVLLGYMMLSRLFRDPKPSNNCVMDGTEISQWCVQTWQKEQAQFVDSYQSLTRALIVGAVVLLVASLFVRIAATPGLYYSSRVVRVWAIVLRVIGFIGLGVILGLAAARRNKIQHDQEQFFQNAGNQLQQINESLRRM